MSKAPQEDDKAILAASVASDAAFAQTIRAANVCREKLVYDRLRPDGNPEAEEG